MSYKNKTYVCFDADSDIHWYRLMTAWKENENINKNNTKKQKKASSSEDNILQLIKVYIYISLV